MARGWESKSVEAQQDEKFQNSAPSRAPLTPEEIVRQRRLQGVRLSRTRVLHQLELAREPRLRQMLQDALAELDRRIQDLECEP
jgi:hypothetical protein